MAVGFYDGDPNLGAPLIGSLQTIPGILVAGTNATVQVPWSVPTNGASHTIYVVVDPANVQADRNRENNTATLSPLAPDLQIGQLTVAQLSASNYTFKAAVNNQGTIPSPIPVEVTFRRGSTNGPVLANVPVNPLQPGDGQYANFVWDLTGVIFTSGVETVWASIDEGKTITEATGAYKARQAALKITLDSVGDGIPNWWRALHFGGDGSATTSVSCATCDPDHDGFDNRHEFLAGTDPLSPNSQPQVPTITTANPLPTGTNGLAYYQLFQATGGTMPYKWQVSAGKLPAGLKLDATSGALVGIPTAAGISDFRVSVMDRKSQSASNYFSMVIRNVNGPLPGTYTGLVLLNSTNLPTQASSGLIQIVLAKTGAFAGNLALDGKRTAFKGRFDSTGNATNPSVAGVSVTLQLDNANGKITGAVTGTNFTSALVAELPNTSPEWQGTYTLVFSPADATATNVPQGYGYATLIVGPTGSGRLDGVLNDGTKLTATAPMLQSDQWPLYVPLYNRAGVSAGSCIGWVNFATNSELSATVYWFAPASKGYSKFTTALTLDGSQFTTGLLASSATVTLGGGGLTNLVKIVTINSAGKVTVAEPSADALTLKLVPTPVTGQLMSPTIRQLTPVFTGSFKPTGKDKAIPFTGLILQRQKTGGGLFQMTNGQTGGVTLDVP